MKTRSTFGLNEESEQPLHIPMQECPLLKHQEEYFPIRLSKYQARRSIRGRRKLSYICLDVGTLQESQYDKEYIYQLLKGILQHHDEIKENIEKQYKAKYRLR